MEKKLYSFPNCLLVFTSAVLLFINYSCQRKNNISIKNIRAQKVTKAIEQEDAMDKAIEQEYKLTRDPATGEVPVERLLKAKKIQLAKFLAATENLAAVPGITWVERGPDNVAGRTRAILYDLNDPSGKKVWAGGVGGGLWYTNDITAASPVWNKVNDLFDNLAITTIAQNPYQKNILMFATGEGWFNFDAIKGMGIWRSMDGGATWTHLPSTINTPGFSFIQKIEFATFGGGGPCPVSNAGVLAATRDSGIYKSIDNGDSWTRSLGIGVGGGNSNFATDIKAIYYYVYASLGGRNSSGGIYRSCNAGTDWVKIYNAAADERRIEIATGPTVNQAWYMYALIQGSDNAIKTIMKTSNADTVPASAVIWKNKTLPPWCDDGTASSDFTRGQAWYDLSAAMDPLTHEIVYIGGVDLFKSTNSGDTWTQISQWGTGCPQPFVHADIHDIIFSPCNTFPCPNNEILVATDGGIFRSVNAGGSFTAKNKSYNVTQYYSCAVHPSSANYFLAGAQDNGTQRYNAAGINSTFTISGGDGGFCHIDEDNPNIQITSYIENNYNVTTDGGASFISYNFPQGEFINPTDYDNTANILYGEYDFGKFFRWANPGFAAVVNVFSVPDFGFAKVTHVQASPLTDNRIYFGLDNGDVVRIDNANGASPTSKRLFDGIDGTSVSCIAIDPANEDHMLVTYSNYGVPSIYESSNANAASPTFSSVEGPGFPDMPVRWVMFDPRNSDWAILATEMGIWSTDNLNGATTDWQPTNNNFANTRVDMLQYRGSDRLLAAATHGRGLFTTAVPMPALPVKLLDFSAAIKNRQPLLQWKTAYEINSKGYNIQCSYNGVDFKVIGFIPSVGNSNDITHYQFVDSGIVQEKNYYRLQQIDKDGRFEYSKVVMLSYVIGTNAAFIILNNPFQQYIDVAVGNITATDGMVSVVDVSGKTLWQNRVYNIKTGDHLRIDLNNLWLNKGVYVLLLKAGEKNFAYRIIKQ